MTADYDEKDLERFKQNDDKEAQMWNKGFTPTTQEPSPTSPSEALGYGGRNHTDLAPSDSEDKGRTADLAAAHELAILEAPVAMAQQRLEREAKDGLTDQEKEYIEIMDNKLRFNKNGEAINTHAFKDVVDNKGRKYAFLHMSPVNANSMDFDNTFYPGHLILICKNGPVIIRPDAEKWRLKPSDTEDEVLKKLNLDELGDILEKPEENKIPAKGYQGKITLSVTDETGPRMVENNMLIYDFTDKSGLEAFVRAVKVSEKRGLAIERSKPKDVKASEVEFNF